MSNDPTLGEQQVRSLVILDDAHRATSMSAAFIGLLFVLVGLSCPVSSFAAIMVEPFTDAGMIHRMANIPIWVMAIMVGCGFGLGFAGLYFGWMQKNAGSPVLAHLRSRPDDALVDATFHVTIRKGNRVGHFHFTTQSGEELYQGVGPKFEEPVLIAVNGVVPLRS